MIEHGELDTDDISRATFHARSHALYFTAEIERPCRIGARRIENGSDVVFEDDGGEKAYIDVAGDLENIFVLPDEVLLDLLSARPLTTKLTTSSSLPLACPSHGTHHAH